MLKLFIIVLLSSAGLCKSVSQKTYTSDMGVYISSVTNDNAGSTLNKITPMVDSNPWVVDDGDDDDNEVNRNNDDNDDNDINDDNNWW